MPLIPAPERQRQEDLCEFEASLVYRVSSRTRLHRETCLEKNQPNKQTKNKEKERSCIWGGRTHSAIFLPHTPPSPSKYSDPKSDSFFYFPFLSKSKSLFCSLSLLYLHPIHLTQGLHQPFQLLHWPLSFYSPLSNERNLPNTSLSKCLQWIQPSSLCYSLCLCVCMNIYKITKEKTRAGEMAQQ